MMPKLNGSTLAKKIREHDSQIPIIFLSAKMLKVDKLKGFDIGADDYLVKPIDEEALEARIKVIIKRTKLSENRKASIEDYFIGSYEFSYSRQTLRRKDYVQELTTREAEILKALCEKMGPVLERKTILKQIWREHNYFARKSMDVFIYKFRSYLSKDEKITIRNIHGR